MKKGALKISQNSQENTCVRVSSLLELQANTFFIVHLRTTASLRLLTFEGYFLESHIYLICKLRSHHQQCRMLWINQ